MTTIRENTKFSFTVMVALLGLAVYAAKIDFQTNANAREIIEEKADIKALEQMQADVAVIKAQVVEINRKIDGP